jgi:hypothetical protein
LDSTKVLFTAGTAPSAGPAGADCHSCCVGWIGPALGGMALAEGATGAGAAEIWDPMTPGADRSRTAPKANATSQKTSLLNPPSRHTGKGSARGLALGEQPRGQNGTEADDVVSGGEALATRRDFVNDS